MVSSKDWKMPGIASIFLVRSMGAVYLVELQVCPVWLVIWEVQSEKESRERARDCVEIIRVESGIGENAEGSG